MTIRTCIIDDDPIFIYTAKALLSRSSAIGVITVCENGQDAYNFILQCLDAPDEMPHLILLDINMPIWDAWNFLDEYQKLDIENAPVIYIVSSSDHPDDQMRSKKYPVVKGFITKPLSEAFLEEILQSLQPVN